MKKELLYTLFFIGAFLVLASVSFGSSLPWESPLTTLRTSMTGTVAFSIALIAICVTGGMLIFGGEINEFAKRGSYVVLVLGLLVAANNALSILFPSASTTGAII